MADSITRKYRNDKIRLTRTDEGKYFVDFKDHRLDITGLEIEVGLMKALKWFGDICYEEAKQELKNGR